MVKGPSVRVVTRGYNGGVPGPTIRVKPGDTLHLTVRNTLVAEQIDTSSLHNEFRDFDTSNVHTHGLHLSGIAPADDVFIEIKPSESYTHTYEIPPDHMGGTLYMR